MNNFSGCLMISATQAISLPLLSSSKLNPHIEGSYNGSVAQDSEFQSSVYVPSKMRSYFVNASVEVKDPTSLVERSLRHSGDTPFDRHFEACCRELDLASPGLVSLEQRTPFGYVGLHSNQVDLFMYGLYNNKCSILYWSAIENLDDVLSQEGFNDFWVHRFRPRRNFSTVLYTKRICSRWYRWKESLKDTSRRFQALERIVFSSWTTQTS